MSFYGNLFNMIEMSSDSLGKINGYFLWLIEYYLIRIGISNNSENKPQNVFVFHIITFASASGSAKSGAASSSSGLVKWLYPGSESGAGGNGMATDQSVEGSSPTRDNDENSLTENEAEAATSMQAKTSSSSGGLTGEQSLFKNLPFNN